MWAAAAFAFFAAAGVARGEGGVAVDWSAPPGCAGGERAARRIAADLGDVALARPTRVDVRVVGTPGRWRAEVAIEGAVQVRREVGASSCETLADAIAIVTVVAIDPFVIVPRVVVPAATSSEPVPTSVPPLAALAPIERGAPPRVRARATGALRLELGAAAFVLPQVGVVLGLVPVVDIGRLRLELPVRWRVPDRERGPLDVSVRMQQLTVGPRACAVPGRGAIGVLLCGGLDSGVLLAAGRGGALVRPNTAVRPWLAVTASAGVRWRIHRRFAAVLTVEGAVPALRSGFHVLEPGDVYETPPATLLAAIGGELHFGR